MKMFYFDFVVKILLPYTFLNYNILHKTLVCEKKNALYIILMSLHFYVQPLIASLHDFKKTYTTMTNSIYCILYPCQNFSTFVNFFRKIKISPIFRKRFAPKIIVISLTPTFSCQYF